MAGEIVKTRGIVLSIAPWSRTSHIVTWLTPQGVVTTPVKGATRPKSFFLGQYDFFYTCELLHYRSSRGDMHAIREVSALKMRESLRGRWRETALAGYVAELVRRLAPSGADAAGWFDWLDSFLDRIAAAGDGFEGALELVRAEMDLLSLCGLAPDLSGWNPREEWQLFALDRGRFGEGERTVRLSRGAAERIVNREIFKKTNFVLDAIRFLGVFLLYHLDLPADVRRQAVETIAKQEGVKVT